MTESFVDVRRRIASLSDELDSMPGRVVQDEIDHLRDAVQVQRDNERELLVLLESGQKNPQHEDLVFPDARRKRSAFAREFHRLLHNYVCSVATLVNQTRVSHRVLHAEPGLPGYRERVKSEFSDDPLAQFVQCLRNYIVHIRMTDLVFEMHFDMRRGKVTRAVGLRLESLRAWDEWTPPAIRFLADAPNVVSLDEVVRQYGAKVRDFYTWYDEALMSTFAGRDLLSYRAKQEEAWALEIELRLLQDSCSTDVSLEQRAFADVLDASQIAEITQLPESSVERAEKAIELLGHYLEPTRRLQEAILAAYGGATPR